jgi:hypothetical protein
LFDGIAAHLSAPEYWWLYALLLSTMIPSLVNLIIGWLDCFPTLIDGHCRNRGRLPARELQSPSSCSIPRPRNIERQHR